MSTPSKLKLVDLKRQLLEQEADYILDRLSIPRISFIPEERPRDSLSPPLVPTCLRQLSLIEVISILNEQLPSSWRKQIVGIAWEEEKFPRSSIG